MPQFFRRKDTILFIVLAALIHILLTFLVSQRVDKITDPQTAAVFSGMVPDKKLSVGELQDVPGTIDEAAEGYRYMLFFLSLPFEPLLQPAHQQWAVMPALEGDIRFDEYVFRASLIGTVTRLLNALVFSLFAYGILFLVVRRIKRKNQQR